MGSSGSKKSEVHRGAGRAPVSARNESGAQDRAPRSVVLKEGGVGTAEPEAVDSEEDAAEYDNLNLEGHVTAGPPAYTMTAGDARTSIPVATDDEAGGESDEDDDDDAFEYDVVDILALPDNHGVRDGSTRHKRINSVSQLYFKSGHVNELKERELTAVFDERADEDGRMGFASFKVASSEVGLEHTDDELKKIFHHLSSRSERRDGRITVSQYMNAVRRGDFLKNAIAEITSVPPFQVPAAYDWTKSTADNYRAKNTTEFHGKFVKQRAQLDYGYHYNYTKERQLWQDAVIESVVTRVNPQPNPWIVYTCGPMGAGKGYALNWMSSMGFFPLENIVHIDPDLFKTTMTEWTGYTHHHKKKKTIQAGTLCHRESGYMQEIAQEVALTKSQNIWIDGSLKDGKWFQHVFKDVRKRFGSYRIAIFYVYASEEVVRERIEMRFRKTGRGIPEEQLVESLEAPDRSLGLLVPLVDFVARIDNNEQTPRLAAFESVDLSGDWKLIAKGFARTQPARADFPDRAAPLHIIQVPEDFRQFIKSRPKDKHRLTHMFERGKELLILEVSRRVFDTQDPVLSGFSACLKKKGPVKLHLSPTYPVSHSQSGRDAVAIPAVAFTFAFCYGIPSECWKSSFELSESQRKSPILSLMVNGGFIYFDVWGDICGVTALSGATEARDILQFGPGVLLGSEASTKMEADLAKFWQPTTLDFQVSKGATHYAWVLPGETYGTNVMNMYGGFAYKFNPQFKVANRIFPVLPN